MNDRMVWIDCEMTGLSLADDALIEVAALGTDSELNVRGGGVGSGIRPPDAALGTRAVGRGAGRAAGARPGGVAGEHDPPGPRRRAGGGYDAGRGRGAGPGV